MIDLTYYMYINITMCKISSHMFLGLIISHWLHLTATLNAGKWIIQVELVYFCVAYITDHSFSAVCGFETTRGYNIELQFLFYNEPWYLPVNAKFCKIR